MTNNDAENGQISMQVTMVTFSEEGFSPNIPEYSLKGGNIKQIMSLTRPGPKVKCDRYFRPLNPIASRTCNAGRGAENRSKVYVCQKTLDYRGGQEMLLFPAFPWSKSKSLARRIAA